MGKLLVIELLVVGANALEPRLACCTGHGDLICGERGKRNFQGTAAVGLLKVGVVGRGSRGTGSLATAYGVWEQEGSFTFIHSRVHV